ncbi:MAG: ribosome silencing factor [Gammaproteobacteria bacterium]|nr:ribosome silencing factor [Gammaproteobacteria bacterium]
MDLETLKALVLEALDEIKAEEVVTLDVQGQTDIADLMVVASGQSKRQIKALAANVVEHAKAVGCRPLGVEGEEDGEWVLVDLGDVIVHLMQPEVRALYDLERLWSLSPGQIESSQDED